MNDGVGNVTLTLIKTLGLGRDLRRFFQSDGVLKALRDRKQRRNGKKTSVHWNRQWTNGESDPRSPQTSTNAIPSDDIRDLF